MNISIENNNDDHIASVLTNNEDLNKKLSEFLHYKSNDEHLTNQKVSKIEMIEQKTLIEYNYDQDKRTKLNTIDKYQSIDSTILFNKLTTNVIEAASAKVLDGSLQHLKTTSKKNEILSFLLSQQKQKLVHYNEIKIKKTQSDNKKLKKNNSLNKVKYSGFNSDNTIFKLDSKHKIKKGKNVNKTKQKTKKKDTNIDLGLNEETEQLDQLDADAENEKQLRLIDDLENGGIIEDIDLTTDDWVNVNPTEITKRYDMLRRYATAKIDALKKDYESLEKTDKEKIDKLKKQYFDHKKLWETEKLVLLNVKDMELNWDQERSDFLDQAELAYKLQMQAQDTAEKAIKQLEDFITEDAKLDRENAENTIQILRERSRTLTSLSFGNKDDDQKIDELFNDMNQKMLSTEKSEKIQVVVENFSMKFTNKSQMDKIIEYINFESSNKYTLVLTQNTNSRPNTREKSNLQSQSPNRKPSSKNGLNREGSNTINNRKSAVQKQQEQSIQPKQQPQLQQKRPSIDQSVDLNKSLILNENSFNDQNSSNEKIEQVLTKVISDDEAMIIELRNSVRSRNSLRSKHLAQLEESKEKLNEIKTISTQKLVSNTEQDIPINEDDLNKSHGTKRDISSTRVKAASEAILNRVSSSKTQKSANSSLIGHPIVLEYIKTYDIIINFKNLICKNLPSNETTKSLFSKHHEKLKQIKLIEFNQELTITPQIINMTTNIDSILNEIQIVFSSVIDELINTNYDLLEKDQQLLNLKSSRPNTSMKEKNDEDIKLLETKLIDLDVQLKEKLYLLELKENQLKKADIDIKNQQEEIKKLRNDLNDLKMNERNENELLKLKENYLNLERKYKEETDSFKNQIEAFKNEIEILKLKNNLDSKDSIHKKPLLKDENHHRPDTNLMFTRLDTIQNEKRLKRAYSNGNISDKEFKNANKLMQDYMALQSNMLAELVKKYMNHNQFKLMQEAFDKNEENVLIESDKLEKMKKLQEKKANRYIETIRRLKEDRIKLAYELNETLNDIEQQSGIFLVKPFYSYQGIDPSLNLMKLNKIHRSKSAKNGMSRQTTSPSESVTSINNSKYLNNEPNLSKPKLNNITNWNVNESIVRNKTVIRSTSEVNLIRDTPRILELDINRLIISQNQISTSVNPNDKHSSSIRSYLAISRPNGSIKKENENNINNNNTDNPNSLSKGSIVQKERIKKSNSQTLLPPINQSVNMLEKSKTLMDSTDDEIIEIKSIQSKSKSSDSDSNKKL